MICQKISWVKLPACKVVNDSWKKNPAWFICSMRRPFLLFLLNHYMPPARLINITENKESKYIYYVVSCRHFVLRQLQKNDKKNRLLFSFHDAQLIKNILICILMSCCNYGIYMQFHILHVLQRYKLRISQSLYFWCYESWSYQVTRNTSY